MAWRWDGFGGGGGEDAGGDLNIWVEDLKAASGGNGGTAGRIWRVQGRGFVVVLGGFVVARWNFVVAGFGRAQGA